MSFLASRLSVSIVRLCPAEKIIEPFLPKAASVAPVMVMSCPACMRSTPSFPFTAMPAVVSRISWFLPCWTVSFIRMFLPASSKILFSPSMIPLCTISWLALREMSLPKMVPLFTMFLDLVMMVFPLSVPWFVKVPLVSVIKVLALMRLPSSVRAFAVLALRYT